MSCVVASSILARIIFAYSGLVKLATNCGEETQYYTREHREIINSGSGVARLQSLEAQIVRIIVSSLFPSSSIPFPIPSFLLSTLSFPPGISKFNYTFGIF